MATTERLAAAQLKLGSGAWLEAETEAREALALDPGSQPASMALGLAVAAMGEADRAALILDNVARLRLDRPHPCQDLATLSPPLPLSLIRRQYHACLRLSPADTQLRLAFAEFLLDHDRAAEAEAVLAETGIAATDDARIGVAEPAPASAVPATAPDTPARRHLMGLAQAEQGHFAAAIASFTRAVELDPDAAASWSNLGMVLKIENRFEAAIEAHDQAVSLAPGNPRFRVNRAVGLLKAGHWESAWLDYEWRLRLTGAPAIELDRLLPSLSSLGDLRGLTIIALHEEGFGDTLQFLRYLPLLAERGARVIACVPQPLVRLMAMVPGVADVLSDASRLPAHDFVCPFFSLPRVSAPRSIRSRRRLG